MCFVYRDPVCVLMKDAANHLLEQFIWKGIYCHMMERNYLSKCTTVLITMKIFIFRAFLSKRVCYNTCILPVPLISLLRDHVNQNSCERFAKDFRNLYWRCLLAVKSNTSNPYKVHVWPCMIDGNVLQIAQRSYKINYSYWLCIKQWNRW